MKKLGFLVAVVASASLIASGAAFASTTDGDLPCDVDIGKGKSLKAPMVRAYTPCGGSTTFASPNSNLGATQTDACAPAVTQSVNLFGKKGKCDVKVKTKFKTGQPIGGTTDNFCFPDDSVASCTVVTVRARCKDIREADGQTIMEEAQGPTFGGWSLNTLTRGTLDDRENGGAHTAIDFPVTFKFPPALGGAIDTGNANANESLFALLGLGSALPPCVSLELLKIAVIDNSGNDGAFATVGVASGKGQEEGL